MAMKGLLADINIQGLVAILQLLLEGTTWKDVWASLGLRIFTLAEVGLSPGSSDAVVWRLCQSADLLLITGNRNKDGPDSLEATIQNENTPISWPLFTLADAESVRHSRAFAERVVERLLEYLLEIESFRGTGRLYLP